MTPFVFAVFLGAFLLLQVQPMIGKFVLPWFGGGTAVWTTCMLFFQTLLLGGYAYAHWSASRWRPRTQSIVHLLLVVAALLTLPAIPAFHWKPTGSENPVGRILLLLLATVGLPYFVLSATGPLVQYWFRLCDAKRSPYWLYALSNAGSLLALLTYPFFFEPVFTRRTQALLWSWGLGLYAVAIFVSALRVWKIPATAREVASESGGSPDDALGAVTVDGKDRQNEKGAPLLWLTLSTCASVLLLAVTNKICLDVVVMPFLWVLPLGLYLLSFVLCFNDSGWYWRRFYGFALIPAFLIGYNEMFEPGSPSIVAKIAIFSWLLFNCCMVCHGELYRLRPPAGRLTGFYLMIAAGGALGGILVAVVAPRIFSDYWELHWGLALFAVALILVHRRERSQFTVEGRPFPVWRAAAFGAVVMAALLVLHYRQASRLRLATSRNFYGVLRVQMGNQSGMGTAVRSLSCGTTLHGFQPLDPELSSTPTVYYHEHSGIGLVMRNLVTNSNRRIGIVGLGIGTLAAYGRPGDEFRFYEINPDVARFANEYFGYLSNSAAHVEIVMGDARLSMERENPQNYDVLVLDAFSSDAIPAHLLTREAFALYLRHLKPGGVIAAHISARHVDLVPVLQGIGADLQLQTADLYWRPRSRPWWALPTHWYLLSANRQLLNSPEVIAAEGDTQNSGKKGVLWTDDYASLLPLIK